jgi:hypothetical protein
MGIKKCLQKKKRIFYVQKKNLEKSNTIQSCAYAWISISGCAYAW